MAKSSADGSTLPVSAHQRLSLTLPVTERTPLTARTPSATRASRSRKGNVRESPVHPLSGPGSRDPSSLSFPSVAAAPRDRVASIDTDPMH